MDSQKSGHGALDLREMIAESEVGYGQKNSLL